MSGTRRLYVHSALGPDQLLIKDATVREELGRLGTMDLDLLSPDENLALDDLLGKGIAVELAVADDQQRYFHGIVAECAQIGRLGTYARYSARVVPWLWLLTRTSDCRIYQQKSVPDIIKSVFREHGTADFEDSLTGSYSPREYCVQYMETDFDFVSRLMEEEGIYYFVEHTQEKDTLVLCDSAGAHSATPNYETISYYPPSQAAVRDEDHIDNWLLSHSMQSGKVSHTDYDFIKPRTSLLSQHASPGSYPKGDAEMFAYPGGYLAVGDGNRYAQRRLEAMQQQHERLVGSGNVRGLAVGSLFTLQDYPREDQNREYLVVAAVHHLGGGDYESGAPSGSSDFTVTFDAIPSQQPYRSLPISRRARVAGPQTAVVVGKAGEEIYTDTYGRVKVQFHWDRYGKKDENSSCWVRVSQVWAGKNWGAMHIPRIGQEVIVDFLEGDPDRPIITGRVYNAAEMPPYDLPANMTQSGIKSRSSKGGSPANSNEIRFEDKLGSEMLTIHAEKDQEISVEHDEAHSVGHDRGKTIGRNETTQVGNNRTETVGNNEQISIGSNRTETVGANEQITIVGNRQKTVQQNEVVVVAMNRSHAVGLTDTTEIGVTQNLVIGDSQNESIGVNRTIAIGGADSLTVSDNRTVNVDGTLETTISTGEGRTVTGHRHTSVEDWDTLIVKTQYTIDAGETIRFQTGDASITLKKDGTITIKGKDITIEGSGKINHTASSDLVLKGSKITHN